MEKLRVKINKKLLISMKNQIISKSEENRGMIDEIIKLERIKYLENKVKIIII